MLLNQIIKSNLKVIIVLLLIHSVFFVLALYMNNIYLADSYEYLNQVENVGKHLSWYCGSFNEKINLDLFSRRPPMYGLFLFVIKSVVNSDYAVLFVQNVLSIINILGVLQILKHYKLKISVNNTVLLFVILYPSQLIYCNLVMSEILFQTFLFWAFFNLFLYLKEKKLNYLLYYNIIIGFATLTKPVLLYFWIPNLLFMLYFFLKRRNFSILGFGLIPLVFIVLISTYNYKKTGYFHYSSIKNNNLIYYYSSFLLMELHGEEEGVRMTNEIREYTDSIEGYAFRSSEKERIGFEIIFSNKIEYSKLHMRGMLNYFIDPGRFDLINFLGIKEKHDEGLLFVFAREGYLGVLKFIINQPLPVILYLVFVLLLNLIMIVSLLYLPFVKKIFVELKIYIILLALYLSFFSGPLGTLRFKIPIYPIILFTIPFLIEGFKNKFFRNRERN